MPRCEAKICSIVILHRDFITKQIGAIFLHLRGASSKPVLRGNSPRAIYPLIDINKYDSHVKNAHSLQNIDKHYPLVQTRPSTTANRSVSQKSSLSEEA